MSENDLRQEIVRVTHIVAKQGLSRSSDGNVSIRLGADRFLVTPSGCHKLSLKVQDTVIVDGEGRMLEGRDGLRPTSELKIHLEAYRQRNDIKAVLHAHPPFATALTIAGLPFPTDYMPEVMMALGDVPTAPYARPGTEQLAASIRTLIRDHDNILLSHHGSLSVGETLEDALISLERLEQAAYTYYLAQVFGEPVPLPEEELAELARLGSGRTTGAGDGA